MMAGYPIRFHDMPAYYKVRPTVKVDVIDTAGVARKGRKLVVPAVLITAVHRIPARVPGRRGGDRDAG